MTDISTIKEILVPIAQSYGVRKLYLFGSYAKGNATEESDIDLRERRFCFMRNKDIIILG